MHPVQRAQEVSQSGSPPLGLLVAAALVVILVTAAALFLLMRTVGSFKHLSFTAAALFLAYNALIVVIKFILSPTIIYEINRESPFEEIYGFRADIFLNGAVVLALYFVALGIIYRYHRRRADPGDDSDTSWTNFFRNPRTIAVGILVGAIVLAGGSLVFYITWFVVWVTAGSTLQYFVAIFQSALTALVVLGLVGATVLASYAFSSARERAIAVGSAAILSSTFVLAVCLLTAYHVLWVVFLLALHSIWPLQVVNPK